MQNWMRMPNALFGKAWIRTGHVSTEELLANSSITPQELEKASLMVDPLGIEESIGLQHADGPSIEELIAGGAKKRRRVVWFMEGRAGVDIPSTFLPQVLVFPVEKRLSTYLFNKANEDTRGDPKVLSSICLSKRTGKELSVDMLKKHTVLLRDGRRELKKDAPNRTFKDLDTEKHNMELVNFCFFLTF